MKPKKKQLSDLAIKRAECLVELNKIRDKISLSLHFSYDYDTKYTTLESLLRIENKIKNPIKWFFEVSNRKERADFFNSYHSLLEDAKIEVQSQAGVCSDNTFENIGNLLSENINDDFLSDVSDDTSLSFQREKQKILYNSNSKILSFMQKALNVSLIFISAIAILAPIVDLIIDGIYNANYVKAVNLVNGKY